MQPNDIRSASADSGAEKSKCPRDERVMCVYANSMRRGLTALAARIQVEAEAPENKIPPILYLPVDRLQRDGTAMTYSRLMVVLDQFYSKQAIDPQQYFHTHDELHEATQRVRHAMTKQDAVVIMDGVDSEPFTSHSIHQFVSDDGAHSVLNNLFFATLPPDTADQVPSSYLPFTRTKFLLLSEHELSPDTQFTSPEPFFKSVMAPSIRLKPPYSSYVDTLVEAGGYQCQKEIRKAIVEQFRYRDTQDTDPLDACYTETSFALIGKLLAAGFDPTKARFDTDENVLCKDLISWISQRERQDYLAIGLLCLAFEGIRTNTLSSFIEQASQMGMCEPPTQTEGGEDWADGFLKRWQGILCVGPDENLPGLDVPVHATRRGIHEPYVELPAQPRSVGFTSRTLKRKLREQVCTSDIQCVGRLHRLISEAALSQHTKIAGSAGWHDTLQPTFYRRLCEGIFHGFAWVQSGAGIDEERANALGFSLPTNINEAYRVLYAIYVRHLLLGHQREFSRRLGQEALVRDLVWLAYAAMPSQTPSGYEGLRESSLNAYRAFREDLPQIDRAPSNLTENSEPGETHSTQDIREDQLESLAQAAFHSSDIAMARKALAELRASERRSSPASGKTTKLLCDISISEGDRAPASDVKAQLRQLSGVDFKTCVKDLVDTLMLAHGSTFTMSTLAAEADNSIEARFAAKRDFNSGNEPESQSDYAGRLALSGDLLSRLAEEYVADHASDAKLEDLFAGFAGYLISARLRRRSFLYDPISSRYLINGHSTRESIRLVLRIASRLRQEPARAGLVPAFLERARSDIDALRRHFFRLPSERPSLLLLEAEYSEVVLDDKLAGMQKALTRTAEAIETISLAPSRARVRIRALLHLAYLKREIADALEESATTEMMEGTDLPEKTGALRRQSHEIAGAVSRYCDQTLPFWKARADDLLASISISPSMAPTDQ